MALSFHTACENDLNPGTCMSIEHVFKTCYLKIFFNLSFSETFKRVALLVSGVKLQDHVVDVVFKMFDENGK